MSGVTGDNPYRASGVIAAAAAGGLSWQAVETGSSMTAEAGNAYWIDTTSNTCTITLPSSASNGDEIMFVDYDRTWGTYKIIIDSNGLNYQGDDDTFDVEYSTDGQVVHIVYSDATNGWIPTLDKTVADAPSKGNSEGIFGYGEAPSYVATTNLISNTGVVSSDVTGVGLARNRLAATQYGGDKGIFGFGAVSGGKSSVTNLVSNTGVCSTDVTGVGTDRSLLAGCSYGSDKGIFGFGDTGSGDEVSMTNLISNTGVVATDTTGVGSARRSIGACEYGTDTAIFAYGNTGSVSSLSNLVSNTGVVATDTAGVGTARNDVAGCSYGEDKGIMGYGATPSSVNMSNLVSNTGVVSTDVTGVGTARYGLASCEYGGDKAIFGFGEGSLFSQVNLVSNTGVVASDTDTSATDKGHAPGCSFN